MEIREATAEDRTGVRAIAERSFQTSYSLSPEQIEIILEGVFSDAEWTDRGENERSRVFVATDGGEPVGFADVKFDDQAILRWLHVEPGHRGEGVGTALFEHVRTAADDRDTPLVGRVLAENDEGKDFCEQFGFDEGEKLRLEFGHETFFGYVHAKPGEVGSEIDERSDAIPETVTTDGKRLTVDIDDETPGTDGPFFRTYEEGSGDSYGYFCSNCESVNVGSDSLGRLECQNCGNKHLADEWDAAYL